jgi:hypothetical protein
MTAWSPARANSPPLKDLVYPKNWFFSRIAIPPSLKSDTNNGWSYQWNLQRLETIDADTWSMGSGNKMKSQE